jgi:hypothetical protein
MYTELQTRAPALSRRSLIRGAAGTLAAAGFTGMLIRSGQATAAARHDGRRGPAPLPKPIPGGLPVGPTGIIHIFLPGPETITLPFTQSTLQGLDVEPSTITNFRGSTALAYLLGTALGSDGAEYNVEVDIRAIAGEYVSETGETSTATFAMI